MTSLNESEGKSCQQPASRLSLLKGLEKGFQRRVEKLMIFLKIYEIFYNGQS